jgi:pimeloyl-ACP methyl ester carboxylesterase
MFALETAALLDERLRSLTLVCTPAPDDEIPWMPDDFRPLVASIAADPSAALALVTEACTLPAEGGCRGGPSFATAEVERDSHGGDRHMSGGAASGMCCICRRP